MNVIKFVFALALGIAGPMSARAISLHSGTIPGSTYTVDYLATVPLGEPSGFGCVKYALHLEGVAAIPEASTCATMLAGLVLVGFVTRRRSQPGSMIS